MLDEKDRKILEFLKNNSKLTTQHISKQTMVPITTVHNRIKKLEKAGIIKGYTIRVDHKKLGYGILAFVLVTVKYDLPNGRKMDQMELSEKLSRHPNVEECHIVAGGTDIILKTRVKDMDELNDFIIRDLRAHEGVDKTTTLVVLSTGGEME